MGHMRIYMKIIKIQFFILLLLFASPVTAQDVDGGAEKQTVQFGEYSVEYNNSEEISQEHTIYKKDGRIVLSVFDTDGDGRDDLWLRYNENFVLDLETSDTTGDGQADTFVSLDTEELVTDIKAPEFVLEEVVLPRDPSPKPRQEVTPIKVNEREVFKLAPPPEKNKFSLPLNWIFAIIVIGGIALYKWKSKKKTKDKAK